MFFVVIDECPQLISNSLWTGICFNGSIICKLNVHAVLNLKLEIETSIFYFFYNALN